MVSNELFYLNDIYVDLFLWVLVRKKTALEPFRHFFVCAGWSNWK